MTSKERQEKLVADMKRWQKVENASIASMSKVIDKTDNPIIRMVAEIIQADSQNHYRLQQMIIDSFEKVSIALQPEDVANVWDLIEEHIAIEKKTIEIGEESLETVKDIKNLAPQLYLLNYLLKDEEKHDYMLEALEAVKGGLYPYA